MAPFKCPDCGIWWAGMEHRCKWYDLHPPTTTTGNVTTGFTIRCTCPPDRGDNYLGTCPIHDIQVTYTGRMWSATNDGVTVNVEPVDG